MTKQEVIDKSVELTKTLGVTVYPITFVNYTKEQRAILETGQDLPVGEDVDIVYGFLKEPPFLVKARAMDKYHNGMGFTANLEILEACIIKEHTDPRMLSEVAPNDKFKLGAAKYAGEKLLIATDQTEKKN